MTVKLAILRSGENIITDIKEGFYEEKLVCYILENPYRVTTTESHIIDDQKNENKRYSISLNKWPTLSKDETVELIPDWIVTLVDPIDELKELYETQALNNIKNEQHQVTSLTEQSNFSESD
jgi:hypothetical protein